MSILGRNILGASNLGPLSEDWALFKKESPSNLLHLLLLDQLLFMELVPENMIKIYCIDYGDVLNFKIALRT